MPSKTINRDESHLGIIDLNKNEIRNPRLHQLAADPSSPVNGQILYRTDTNKIRAYINGAWQDLATVADLASAGIPASTFTAKGQLIVATGSGAYTALSPGADGTLLVAASGQASGLQWRTLASGDIPTSALQERISTTDLTDWPRTAALDLNGQKITGMADGTATTDAATFGQLSAILQGQVWKQPVQVVATSNITLSGLQTIDGYTTVAGDRVLAAGQTTAANSGIYIAAAGAWTRATDADIAAELNNATVLVENGTNNKGDIFTQTATIATLGTTSQVWVKTADTNTVYTADGTTLTLTGTTFSITNLGVGTAQLAAQAVTAAKLGAVTGNGLTGGAGSVIAVNPGTGISVGATVSVDTTVVARKATGTLTGGANSEVLTHNLGTRVVQLSLRNNASPYDEVEVYNEATTTNTVTVYAASGQNLPAGYTWIIVG